MYYGNIEVVAFIIFMLQRRLINIDFYNKQLDFKFPFHGFAIQDLRFIRT